MEDVVVELDDEPVHVVLPLTGSARSDISTNTNPNWHLCGHKYRKNQIVFGTQVVIAYTVILSCIVNLILQRPPTTLWISLLSSLLGLLMPAPKLKLERNESNSR